LSKKWEKLFLRNFQPLNLKVFFNLIYNSNRQDKPYLILVI